MVNHATICKHASRRILSSFASFPSETLAPFLYFTQSITRCYGTVQTDVRRAEGRSSRGQSKVVDGERQGRLRRGQQRLDGVPARPSIQLSTRPAPRIEHVPFEGAASKSVVVESALSDGSTVTPSERRAFQSLLALRRDGIAREDTNVIKARDGQIKRASDHEVNDFQSVEARGRDSEVKEAAGPSLDARSAAEIKTVDSLMADTQTDADLWRVLHERVISRVLALQLDTSEKPTEDLDKARTPIKKAKGKKSKTLPVTAAATPAAELATTPSKATPVPSAQDLHLLTQTFPIHLLNFTKRCSSSFPGSSLPSNLLPYIKSLGPTTFAMAATTSLYNHHMSQLYYQHLDLPSIIATLEEMDQQVYDFDTATYNLLGKILHRANEARLGHLGPGTQAIWGSERMRSALKGIAEWKAKVLVQMEARALHVARSQPALENRRDKSLVDYEM